MTHVRSMPSLLRRISSTAVLRGGAGTPLEAGKPPSEPVRAHRDDRNEGKSGRERKNRATNRALLGDFLAMSEATRTYNRNDRRYDDV